MSFLTRTTASPILRSSIPRSRFALATISRTYVTGPTKGETGGQPNDHTADKSGHDIQSEASQKGRAAHQSGSDPSSGATDRADHGNQNAQAKKDHPEAPGPVIGMNDERGGKGNTSQ